MRYLFQLHTIKENCMKKKTKSKKVCGYCESTCHSHHKIKKWFKSDAVNKVFCSEWCLWKSLQNIYDPERHREMTLSGACVRSTSSYCIPNPQSSSRHDFTVTTNQHKQVSGWEPWGEKKCKENLWKRLVNYIGNTHK